MTLAVKPPSVRRARRRGFNTSGALSVGAGGIWLSIIVLLPIAALVAKSLGSGLGSFWGAVSTDSAISSFEVTFITSGIVTVVNAVVGLQIAWTLTRDNFPGQRFVDALIDLPFALPTIVASIVLLALYGATSPVGVHIQQTKYGVMVALLFVTLPFVVRSVQPVILELERSVEEAAATLGAGPFVILRSIILPALGPALLSGAGLAFSRAIGEFGSVVLIGGGIPRKTEVSSQYIRSLIEQDSPSAAAAVSVVLLVASFVVLFLLRLAATRLARKEAPGDTLVA